MNGMRQENPQGPRTVVLTGRSRRLWPRVLTEMGEAYRQGHDRLLLITPDQYTLQAELDLVDQLNLPGLLQMEVLSPSRLTTRVFALAGMPQRTRIDTRGKAMMLAEVLRESRKELVYYGGAALRRGFAERLSQQIADLKRAGMPPEALLSLSETVHKEDALQGKLRDIGLLYARYEARLEGAFIDGEDVQEALLQRLPESGLLAGARVWIYGFDLISPQFAREIILMARHAASVRLALTLETAGARDQLVFLPARETLARLARAFDGAGLLWEREHVDAPLPAAGDIAHLERELFALPPIPGKEAPEAVVLRTAPNPYDEALQAAEALLRHARAGIPFDEMVVVLGDAEGYAGAVSSAFERSGVPFHLASKRPALSHPLLASWLAALRCVTKGWRAEDALDYLKGGFSGLARDEAERLENYALENGLHGAKWRKPLRDPALSALRDAFIAPLVTLQEGLRSAKSATDTLAAAYGLLEDVSAHATLSALQDALLARGLRVEAADCAQAWRLLLETLDQLHALLRGSRLPMAGLSQVVEAGLSMAELAAVPTAPGMVQAGQLGHMKIGGRCRVLFLLGMQDGVMRVEGASLLSDAEAQRALAGTGNDAAFGLRGDALAQLMQMNLLDTLAAPTERLYISHALASAGGEAQRPAAVLKLLHSVFPKLQDQGGVTPEPPFFAPGTALDAFGPLLRAAAEREGFLTDREARVAAHLLRAPETRDQAEKTLHAFEAPPLRHPLPRRTAARLYRHTGASISRLEAFAHCPYRHFITYGLRPIPRQPYAVQRSDTGTFYHRAMEGYTRLAAEDAAWPGISKAQSDALMDTALAPLRAEWADTALSENAMLRATGESFCRIARRAAWTYTGQMRKSGFHTGVVEARFGVGAALPPIALRLPEGEHAFLEGRIDRIDFYEEDGEKWLRVIDYKSGGTRLEPARMAAGLQLQLLLYLEAALSAFPGVEAGGAFYSRFDDPLVETDSRDAEEIERKIAEALRLRGIALSDLRVLRALSNGDSYLTAKGEVKKSGDAMAPEALAALMRYAHGLSETLAAQIAQGEIDKRPAQLSSWRACAWCDYREACGFDGALPGNEPRRLENCSKEDLIERAMGPGQLP